VLQLKNPGASFEELAPEGIKFRQLLRCYALDLSALTNSKLTGLSYATTHRFHAFLRQRLIALALQEAEPFAGKIEIDESYFGPRRVRGKRGRGAGGKTPAIGLHKRGLRQVPHAQAARCAPGQVPRSLERMRVALQPSPR
jgi:transposase